MTDQRQRQEDDPMRKQPPTFEWQIVENDKDWMHLCAQILLDRTPSKGMLSQGRLFSR